ncbi:hypothetical protein ABVK25_006667 [Lepraria finkii]|uniref:Uncharacterized protein n=1 Tax=Lepraria finkii TaxID=1340010 RepID=A0ABR4B592_9LECA
MAVNSIIANLPGVKMAVQTLQCLNRPELLALPVDSQARLCADSTLEFKCWTQLSLDTSHAKKLPKKNSYDSPRLSTHHTRHALDQSSPSISSFSASGPSPIAISQRFIWPGSRSPLTFECLPSIPSNLSAPFHNIICYNSGHDRQPINIEICRPTLTILRQFPTYRTVQCFEEHKEPRLPNTPPYVINAGDTTCAIEISSRLDEIEDSFSFEQARTLATTILEECASRGHGGQSTIGLVRNGWWVKVVGFKED